MALAVPDSEDITRAAKHVRFFAFIKNPEHVVRAE